MGVSKVVYGDDTLVDLTGDTVTPTSLTLGATAHGADGEPIVGEYQYVLPPMSSDVRGGARIQPDSGLEITDNDSLQVRLALESDGTVRGGIAELQAKGHAEQRITTGKNLFNESTLRAGDYNGANSNVRISQNVGDRLSVTQGEKYTLSGTLSSTVRNVFILVTDDSNSIIVGSIAVTALPYTYNVTASGRLTFVFGGTREGSSWSTLTVDDVKACDLQLELGSTATEYEPYTGAAPSPSPEFPQTIEVVTGHEVTGKTGRFVDLVVKQGNTTLSTTPIPLPSRGWVAGLPDGTADALRLDGAGKCEWVLPTSEMVLDGSESGWSSITGGLRTAIDVSGIKRSGSTQEIANAFCSHFIASGMHETSLGAIGVAIGNGADQIVFTPTGETIALADWKTWLSTHNVTVLYPLATPVTEDCGYVDMPAIASAATISIPELDALNVKYFIDDAVLEYGRQMYERAVAEIGGAVVDLAARVAALES